jgi:hypothetical protein
MASGPSKQELEMYWNNSRQYFDELAKHYQETDPEYYRTNILPFYNNPFQNTYSTQNKKSGNKAAALFAVMGIVAILGVGAAVLFFVLRDSSTEFIEKQTQKIEESIIGKDLKEFETIEKDSKENTKDSKENTKDSKETVTDEEDSEGLNSDDHFIIGSKKISEKDYDKAEYHFKKVKKGTQYYEQSQQLLKNMKYLRKYAK